jgi:hypothetical protein
VEGHEGKRCEMNMETTEKESKKRVVRVKVRPAALILLAVALLVPTAIAPRLNAVNPTTFPCDSSKTVLLIQDDPPRFSASNHDPNGADVNELMAQNLPFCMISSDQLGSTNLAQFSEIIIASTQNQAFYDNLFPDGSIDPSISDWVQHGGVLSANLADCASGGSWSFTSCGDSSSSYTFLGGVTHVVFFSNDNSIISQSHPIITGQFGGTDGGQIVDDSCLQDLDCWQYASHGYFTNLPAGTTIILSESNGPVFIEYRYGDGLVIATTTSIEWRYDYFQQDFQNLKLLANEIGYQAFKTNCQQNDGEGEFEGSHGHGHFKHHFRHDHHKCQDNQNDEVSSTDRGDGKAFHSTWIQSAQVDKSVQLGQVTRTVTIIGLGTIDELGTTGGLEITSGLPVSFTYMAVETTPTSPGWVSFSFSDGFTNTGPVTIGSIALHGW